MNEYIDDGEPRPPSRHISTYYFDRREEKAATDRRYSRDSWAWYIGISYCFTHIRIMPLLLSSQTSLKVRASYIAIDQVTPRRSLNTVTSALLITSQRPAAPSRRRRYRGGITTTQPAPTRLRWLKVRFTPLGEPQKRRLSFDYCVFIWREDIELVEPRLTFLY